MLRRFLILCSMVLLLSASWAQAAALGPVRVRLQEGDISYRPADTQEWQLAGVNTPLDEGDAFWCPAGSRAELQLPDGTLIRVDGGSQLYLLANENGFVHLHLASGRLYLRTSQSFRENALQIDADDTTVIPSGRTRLRLDMLANSQEDVSIFKGSAYVEGNGSRTRVRAGEHIALEEGHNELLPLNPPDGWEQWNMERDRALARASRGDNYLPDELRGYSDELAQNGTWVSTAEYGMVWRPTVVVSADWAPYRDGYWVWRGNDQVWVSYEYWGWAPYHYGRWAFTGSYGWCWVPPVRGDVYWGPGYVGWYTSGDLFLWTPLAPGEIFYGYGSYGRYSVNITNVVVNPRTIVYRNSHVRGGVSGVRRDDFVRGHYRPQPAPRDVRGQVATPGSPRIPGARSHVRADTPRVKQTPPTERQHREVVPAERKPLPELRQRFPRVTPAPAAGKGQEKSVAPNRPSIPERSEFRRNEPAPQSAPVQHPRLESPRPAGPGATGVQPRAERPQPGGAKPAVQPKRVWRVTTPEHGREHGRERDGR